MIKRFCIVFIIIFSGIIILNGQSTIITVGHGGQYAKLQDAIDAASSYTFIKLKALLSENAYELKSGVITRDEYFEWKINWPYTCDDCGKYEPKKQWRKNF